VAAALAAGFSCAARPARGDVSSWLFVGSGPSWLNLEQGPYKLRSTMQIDLGVGTPPSGAIVVGGLTRMTTFFGKGTDMALAVRVATQRFVLGDWGAAFDAGGFGRWWGDDRSGYLTTLQLGAPYGLTLSLNGSFGSDGERTYGALFGVDFLRLTVYRLGGESWWVNPRPAWRPGQPAP
jgi:hypothetical protein